MASIRAELNSRVLYSERLLNYKLQREKHIAGIKQEEKNRGYKLGAFAKHIKPCLNKNDQFNAGTIATLLAEIGEPHPKVVGGVINLFNSVHSGNYCPLMFSTTVNLRNLSANMHSGTTRVFNKAGDIDEARWDEMLKAIYDPHRDRIYMNDLFRYLKIQGNEYGPEKGTGRTEEKGKAGMQSTAAVKAWEEYFDRLAAGCDSIKVKDKMKKNPYITLRVFREFFEDTELGYLRAKCRLLPLTDKLLDPGKPDMKYPEVELLIFKLESELLAPTKLSENVRAHFGIKDEAKADSAPAINPGEEGFGLGGVGSVLEEEPGLVSAGPGPGPGGRM